LVGRFRYRLTAKLLIRTLIREHSRSCDAWPGCSSLWHYEVMPSDSSVALAALAATVSKQN
jgi:hypothetical protein